MANERLDQILLRKGLVTEDQIRQALLRQKSHRGPLGSHLLYYKFITERDLVLALAEQFGVPGVELGNREIPPEVIRKVPVSIAEAYGVCPFAFDPETRTLSIAVQDPDKAQATYLIKEASGAWHVEPHIAAESVLRNTIRLHYHGKAGDGSIDQIIELPDLFEGERPSEDPEGSGRPVPSAEETPLRKVLMVTRSPFLKSLLVSIFEREGAALTVLAEKEDVVSSLQESVYDHILVSEDLEERFLDWVRTENLSLPRGERSIFSSVSRALLDNHAPYHRMAGSLINALLRMAEHRNQEGPHKPPYAWICKDAADLAHSVGLSRLATDGVRIAALLLTPARHVGIHGAARPGRMGLDFFESFEDSLETAKALCFSWDVFECLSHFARFLAGEVPHDPGRWGEEEHDLAAQILALVWFRHAALGRIDGSPEEALAGIRSALLGLETPLAAAEVSEAYLRLLEERQGRARIVTRKDVFIVSQPSDGVRQLMAHLRQDGLSIVEIGDLPEALHLHERRQPDAIVVHYDDFPEQVARFCRFVRRNSATLLYALTGRNKPSLIMSLLDAGFDDVFVPPFNYELLTARMKKAMAAQEQQGRSGPVQAGFRGTFRELPFVDLMQALAMSQRSCTIRLEGGNGDRAKILMREGRMVYAECGEAAGVEAVYAVIRWREDGAFQIGPADDSPPQNITLPNDFVLMEGCRRLDEGLI